MSANDIQVGGEHYKAPGKEEHWDRVHRLGLDYFQGQITKYVERCWAKNGIEDLEKARHFLDKYLELSKAAGRQGKAQVVNALQTSLAEVLKPKVESRSHLGFTYEGGYVDRDEYRCVTCRERFVVGIHDDPRSTHVCEVKSPL